MILIDKTGKKVIISNPQIRKFKDFESFAEAYPDIDENILKEKYNIFFPDKKDAKKTTLSKNTNTSLTPKQIEEIETNVLTKLHAELKEEIETNVLTKLSELSTRVDKIAEFINKKKSE